MTNSITWQPIKTYNDILFDFCDGIAKITINRPERRNAFTPLTVQEMIDAMLICRENPRIQVIILTRAGDKAFCSGGDQSVRGVGGYVGKDQVPRLNVLDLQEEDHPLDSEGRHRDGLRVTQSAVDTCCMRSVTSTIAAENARFGQTGPKVGVSMEGLAHVVPGARRRPEEGSKDLVPLRPNTTPRTRSRWGWSNKKVVPLDQLEVDNHRMLPQDPGQEPALDPPAKILLQRRVGRPGRHPGAGRQRHVVVLPLRGSTRRPERLR